MEEVSNNSKSCKTCEKNVCLSWHFPKQSSGLCLFCPPGLTFDTRALAGRVRQKGKKQRQAPLSIFQILLLASEILRQQAFNKVSHPLPIQSSAQQHYKLF